MNLNSSHTTAVLVFALSSEKELQRKKIAKGEQLFDALTQSTLQTVKKTGLPIFHISEDQQSGSSFGERFTNAVQHVFKKGFENVIAVGNDSPHLSVNHIEAALSNLENNKTVIGPSADGGFYLLGLHHSNFDRSDFAKLSWQTSELKDEIVKFLSDARQETLLLPKLLDIDSLSDAKIVGNYSFGLAQKILNAIRSLISSNEKIEIPSLSFADGFYSSIPFNKGSPSAFSF